MRRKRESESLRLFSQLDQFSQSWFERGEYFFIFIVYEGLVSSCVRCIILGGVVYMGVYVNDIFYDGIVFNLY